MFVTCPKCSAKYQIPDEVRLMVGKKLKCSNCQHLFVYAPVEVEKNIVEEAHAVPESVVENIDPVIPVVEEDSVFAAESVVENTPSDIPTTFTPIETDEGDFPPVVKHGYGRVFGILILFALIATLVVLGILYRDVLISGMNFPFSKEEPVVIPENTKSVSVESAVVSAPVADPAVISKPMDEIKPVVVQTYVEQNPQVIPLPEVQSVRFEVRMAPEPTVYIEGIVKNDTATNVPLPEKVRAVAYDAQGTILFEKEIYLTDRILPAGESRSFFGSYAPAPEKIQWVDVTF